MGRKNEYTFSLYVDKPDGTSVPLESLTPEERRELERKISERVSVVMSAYYSRHLDEFAKLESLDIKAQ